MGRMLGRGRHWLCTGTYWWLLGRGHICHIQVAQMGKKQGENQMTQGK